MVKYNIIIYVIILKSKYGALIFQFLYYQTWYTFFFFLILTVSCIHFL